MSNFQVISMQSNTAHSGAIGLATKNANHEIIEVYYPHPQIQLQAELLECILGSTDMPNGVNGFLELDSELLVRLKDRLTSAGFDDWAGLLNEPDQGNWLVCISFTDVAPASIPEAFLKLHLLSHRLVRPHGINLDGLFGTLKNLAWTNAGPIDLTDLPARQLAARKRGLVLDVMSVDKFPKMTNYVVPAGVRLADTARIRLGAFIGEGTTVMHEGFVNFNAGTLGTAMVEGRISAGVVVGKDSDLGGGCSTMGTLSGGGTTIISVGENCLIGANAGIGFPLADGCTVEAGLYVTAGTKVNLLDAAGNLAKSVKAVALSDTPDLLFRRNSLSGAVEATPKKSSISLNDVLHSNN